MIDTTDIPLNSSPSIEDVSVPETPAQGERFFLLLAIFIGRLFLLVNVVSSEIPSDFKTDAIKSCEL